MKSWAKPVDKLKELHKNRCNIIGVLGFFPYCWSNGLKNI